MLLLHNIPLLHLEEQTAQDQSVKRITSSFQKQGVNNTYQNKGSKYI